MSQNENEQETPQEQQQPGGPTPLDLVRKQQAERQENKEVQEQNADRQHEVPGQGPPNERMHHPNRILY